MVEEEEVEEEMDEEEIKLTSAYEKKEIITSGNAEIDKKMGGGIPAGSLTLIEGANDTGKSVLTQQLMWGDSNKASASPLIPQKTRLKACLSR